MDDHQERELRAEFEAEIRKLDAPRDALDRWPDGRYLAEAIEDYWTGFKMARRSSPSTQRQGEGWGPIKTVGDMVRNLLTLDQSAPIHAAFHVDFVGERRCRTRPLTISRERVIDGKWVDNTRKDVPYEHVVWAKRDERQGEEARDAARLQFLMRDIDGFVGVKWDKHQYAIHFAKHSGRDEPTEEDELLGLRMMIDAAMVAHPGNAAEGSA
ncbi:hypothetical protein IM543_11435 [Massilia sp. UMI-21]|nr:hypothetical protein IM543_11435 [Massilia sp. UMI-21]